MIGDAVNLDRNYVFLEFHLVFNY